MSPDVIDPSFDDLPVEQQIIVLKQRAIANRIDLHAARRSNYVLYLMVATLIAILAFVFVHDLDSAASLARRQTASAKALSDTLAGEAYRSCLVQARGVPASRQLGLALADARLLVTLRPTKKVQALERQIYTPAQIAFQRRVTADMAAHLARFESYQAHQPQRITCKSPAR